MQRAFRLLHSAIFVGMAFAVVITFWCAVTNSRGPLLWTCLALISAECIAYMGNGMKCPLTPLAGERALEAFIPEWHARRTPLIFGSLFAVSVLILVFRR